MVHTYIEGFKSAPSETVLALETRALKALRTVLRQPSAVWSGEGQRRAVLAVLQHQHDIITVLATGSGKTMLVLLPAILELQRTTVVVLPLRALLHDLVRRLTSLEVRHEVWIPHAYKNQPLHPDVNLVLVSIENAQKPSFKTALLIHHQHHPIARIVFDEVHEAITAFTYRPSFLNINELRSIAPVQFVLMSATVPPTSIPQLYDTFQLESNTAVVRTTTIRPELQYIIELPQNNVKAMNARVGTLVETYSRQFHLEDRGLIYVEKKATSHELARLMGIPHYEGGDTMTDEQRMEAYNKWINGGAHWMVCTSAFSAGIDCRTVRVVIHAGGPFTITGLAQQFGRGGRDGLHALGIIVPLSLQLWKHAITNLAADHTGEKLMQKLLFGPTTGRNACIRFQLSLFLDGVGVACTDAPTVAQCSRCSPDLNNPAPLTRAPHTFDNALIDNSLQPKRTAEDHNTPADFAALHVAAKKQKTHRLQTTNALDNTLEALFKQWQGTCLYCLHLDPSHVVIDHTFFKCPQLSSSQLTDYRDLRRQITFDYSSITEGRVPRICFKCGVPQINKLHDTFGRGDCKYEDLVFPTMWIVFSTPSLKEIAQKHFQQDWTSVQLYTDWLAMLDKNNLPNLITLWQWYISNL